GPAARRRGLARSRPPPRPGRWPPPGRRGRSRPAPASPRAGRVRSPPPSWEVRGAALLGRAHQLGDAEGQVQRLARVQAGVTERGVVAVEMILEHLLPAAQGLRYGLCRALQVHATGPGALAQAGREEALDLAQDVLEPARL